MEYLREPFDFKLFILKMLGKWYQFVICTLIGAILFGGTYYLYKVVYAPAREYSASATYYIEYVKDPWLSEQGSYFNIGTLDSWLNMDVFTEQVLKELDEVITPKELDSYVEMIMPSDVRVVSLNVKTADPKLSAQILQAYNNAFIAFGENQREINRIVVQDFDEEATQIKADIRTQRAFVLGGVLGLVLGGLYIVLKYMLDDAIYLPGTLSGRHGLTVFGTGASEELAVNVSYAVSGCKKVAVTAVGDTPELPQVIEMLQKSSRDTEWLSVPSMVQCPEAAKILRNCDKTILTVVSGVDKSGAIDRALSYYKQQDISVAGAVLWEADEKLLKCYGYLQSKEGR